MTYLVTCAFDLKGASSQDYVNAYTDLKTIGLNRVLVHTDGDKTVIPTTTVGGQFNGTGASAICVSIRDKVQKLFQARSFKSEIFITVGGDWSYVGATT